MGALPSRESNEDPSTVFFANCGSHVVFHVPMTPHFFPSPDSLAFQQLLHARNNQSALYCFDVKDVSSVLPPQAAEAFREAQNEDWGAEVEETDPSVHYYDAEINEKIQECGGSVQIGEPVVGEHFKHSIEDAESLYKVLVEEPTAGTLVDTDAEMCELFEAEQRWRAAVSQEFAKAATQPNSSGSTVGDHCDASSNDISAGDATGLPSASLPPPPRRFLYPLPHAIALRMTTEEEEEMRAEYCRLHNIPYIAPHFHAKPGSAPPMMDAASLAQLGVPRASSSTCFVACPLPLPLPLVERRRYHFEDDPKYRDGRVHLVEEHGVLYHFAYLPKKRRHHTAPKTTSHTAAGANSSSNGNNNANADALRDTPMVLDRCLHDVVYSEEPNTSVSNSKQVAPAKRYGHCARCGARIEQRLDYTQLRQLKATRQQRRELAKQQRQQQHGSSSNNSADALEQQQAWTAFAAAHDAQQAMCRPNDSESDEAPGSDSDLEVASHTERVEEEGETEFVINIAPVRIAGMDGLLPSRTRGTPWLRGYEHEGEAAADAYVESLTHKPPVMRTCRFIEGSVGDKIVNRASLVAMLSYRPMCRQAGLSNALTRPVWSTCVLSNIPYLQMVRETFFRAKAAVAEIDDKDMLLRKWLDVVDRENNFYNFINANLYMIRNFTPPERTVRQHEPSENTLSSATIAGAASALGSVGVGTGHGNSVASPSSVSENRTKKATAMDDGASQPPSNPRGDSGSTRDARSSLKVSPQQQQQSHSCPDGEGEEAVRPVDAGRASALAPRHRHQQQQSTLESAGGDAPSSASSSSSPLLVTIPVAPAAAGAGEVVASGHHGRLVTPITDAPLTGAAHADPHAGTTTPTTSSTVARRDATDVGKSMMTSATAMLNENNAKQSRSSNYKNGGCGAELRSHRVMRDLEEATIGRPEGQGPRDVVDDDVSSDDEVHEVVERVEGRNDAAARAARRREEKRQAERSAKSKTKKYVAAAVAERACGEGVGSTTTTTVSPAPSTTKGTNDAVTTATTLQRTDAVWRNPVTAGVTMSPLADRGAAARDHDHDDVDANDGGEASGRPLLPTRSTPSPRHRSAHQLSVSMHTGEEDVHSSIDKDAGGGEEGDDDTDLRMEEEESIRGNAIMPSLAAPHAGRKDSPAHPPFSSSSPLMTMMEQQQRIEVPPRPDFQLFSSRLEPHAPLSLYSLFDYDVSADVMLGTIGSSTDTVSPVAAALTGTKETDDTATAAGMNNESGEFISNSAAGLPSYVQHDVLRENERRQAEPKSLRRPSHALYECGMLATTRGRSFLFLLREDCVHALLYYLSCAAAPIFIGAYIEPVDTTSVSYGGAVRLQNPSSVNMPLSDEPVESRKPNDPEQSAGANNNNEQSTSTAAAAATATAAKHAEDGGEQRQSSGTAPLSGAALACSSSTRRVIIGPVEGMEVMAEYYKSKGLITCFSISDVERIAPGPSAAHRLRKMILPSSHPANIQNVGNSSSSSGGNNMDNVTSGSESEERALMLRQAREATQYGHTFTYAAHEFRDGDLVVYNFDERRWEHYEHVQLRRRFAAKAAAVAAAAAGSPFQREIGGGHCRSSPMGHSSTGSSSFNSTTALGLLSTSAVGATGGGGGVAGRVNDDVAGVVDGSVGCASSIADASMSARLLCVGLDELLLSWTKWIVDNRFYEDRSDLGWLNLPDGSPIQLGGRYFLWSFRHNHQRYFYGVIPKFAKGRLRRQKLMERNRKKKELSASRGASATTAATSTSTLNSDAREGKRKGHKSASRSPFTNAEAARGTTPCGHSNSSGTAAVGRGERCRDDRETRVNPTRRCTRLSSLHSQELLRDASSRPTAAVPFSASTSYTLDTRRQQEGEVVPSVTSSSAPQPHSFAQASEHVTRRQQQQHQQHYGSHKSMDSVEATAVHAPHMHSLSDAPHSSPLMEQGNNDNNNTSSSSFSASHFHSLYPPSQPIIIAGGPHGPATAATSAAAAVGSHSFLSVRVGSNVVYPPLPSSSLASSSPVVVAGGATTHTTAATAGAELSSSSALRCAPLLRPPPTQPHRGTPRSPLFTSPGQLQAATSAAAVAASGANYYYQYGGNTFIQDGKRHENEYYPPLPQSMPFHPASQAAAARLVPLPHPQAERGGIPAMFRYWGPVGHPSPSSSSSRSNTLPRPSMSVPLAQQQQQQQQHSPLSSSACTSVVGGAAATATTTAVMSVGGNPLPTSTVNGLTVRVRRRGVTASTVPATTAAAAGLPLFGPSSLSVSVTTMALGPPSDSVNSAFSTARSTAGGGSHAVVAGFPGMPVLHGVEPQPCSLSGGGVGGIGFPSVVGSCVTASSTTAVVVSPEDTPQRLSPTSMLPANLINEGSKTKGESVLRVDEDTYVQREAFRWNPYASTKWATNTHENGGAGL